MSERGCSGSIVRLAEGAGTSEHRPPASGIFARWLKGHRESIYVTKMDRMILNMILVIFGMNELFDMNKQDDNHIYRDNAKV